MKYLQGSTLTALLLLTPWAFTLLLYFNHWRLWIKNYAVMMSTGMRSVKPSRSPHQQKLKKRKWKSTGHTLRKPNDITKAALEWNPQVTRKRRHPRITCQWTVLNELKTEKKRWAEVKSLSSKQNQTANLHSGPMLHWGVKGTDDDDDDDDDDDIFSMFNENLSSHSRSN
jgi:hypothetical protein